MALTHEQKLTLKTWLQANAQAMNDQQAADALNAQASPDYFVYRTSVSWDTIMTNGMDFTRVDNLQNGNKWRIWEWMFKNDANAINPSKTNIRAGINATWVGTAQDLAVRAAVYGHCYKAATVAEKLFATGVGTAPSADGSGPGTVASNITGPITAQDVIDAYNEPA